MDPATLLGDRLECLGSLSFSVAEWNRAPILSAQDPSPAATALRREVGRDQVLARWTWHRVAATEAEVLFAAASGAAPPEGLFEVAFVPDAARPGEWKWRTLGNCALRPAVASGRSRADVFLDPARLPTAADRTIHLMIRETACASGQLPAGRVLAPTLRLDPTSIKVLITISTLPGAQDCQGVDAVPYDLTRPEPLGNRTLLDGGQVPAAPIIEEITCCG